MRVVRELGQRIAQSRDRRLDRRRVGSAVARQRHQVRRVAGAADHAHVEIALLDMTRLADPAAVHPHEVGLLGREADRVALAGRQRAVRGGGDLVEIAFHRHAGVAVTPRRRRRRRR